MKYIKNALIITETNVAINKESKINFIIKTNKLKFEISANNAEGFGLDSSNLQWTMQFRCKQKRGF